MHPVDRRRRSSLPVIFGAFIAVATLMTCAGIVGIPQAASAAELTDGMINCSFMRRWWPSNSNTAETPRMLEAIRQGHWDAVQEYLEDGVKIPDQLSGKVRDRVRREMASARLFVASARGDLRLMRRFLHRGADPNAVSTSDFMSPLAWAAVCDHPMAVDLLVSHGASVDLHYGYANGGGVTEQTTALLDASSVGARRAVAALLAHHANPNAEIIGCAKWDTNDDESGGKFTCKRGRKIVDNAISVARDPVIRRMLRAAGAGKVVHWDNSSPPAGLSLPIN